MAHLRKVATQSSYYLFGRAFTMALGFVSFPLFTRLLDVNQYGLIGLVATVVLSVGALSKLGMQHALQRFHRERSGSSDGSRRYYSTLFWGASIGALLIIATYAGVLTLLPRSAIGDVIRSLLLLASVLMVVRAVQSMVSNLLLVEGKAVVVNAIDFATKALTIGVVYFLLLHWERSARAYLAGMTLAEITLFAITFPYVLRRSLLSVSEFDTLFWRETLLFAIPMVGAELAAVVLDTGDRFLVQHFLGPTDLGYYAAAYGLAQYAWDLMVIPISMVFFPICMETWVEKGKEETQQLLSKSLRYFLVPAVWLLCLVVLGSRDVIVILASKKFQPAYTLLPTLVAGMVAAALPVFFRVGLMIQKKSASVAIISGIAIVANVVLNVVLLPRIGLQGAAIATLAAYAMQALLMAQYSRRALPFAIPYRAIVRYLLCAGLATVVGLQFRAANPWLELPGRMAIALIYPALLWASDEELRSAVRTLFQRRRAATAAIYGN